MNPKRRLSIANPKFQSHNAVFKLRDSSKRLIVSQAVPVYLSIPVQQLIEYTHKNDPDYGALRMLTISSLAGGYVAANVYRLDLQFDSAKTISFVQKHTSDNETRLMKLLTDLALPEIPPVLSDSGEADASWFITPFYEGRLLAPDDDIPLSILKTLAAVHAFYSTRTEQIRWLPQVDGAFVERLVQYTTRHLEDNRDRLPASVYANVLQQLQSAETVPILDQTFQHLPKTLTHGDVHSGNILETMVGKHILFDWGNARIAPAMLDLANKVKMGSGSWKTYLDAWEAITGSAFDSELASLGYVWAIAIVNLQYLPFALAYLEPTIAQEMADKLCQALATLQQRL